MSQKVVVTVKEGKVRGFKTKSHYSGIEYYSFLGIPYGQSTKSQARFKDPVKVKPWNTILDATAEKTGCLQYSFRKKEIAGDEDCLYNNIHTTQIAPKVNNLKAVIVNIHPGGFFHGSPDPDYYGSPEYIINRDVVYVCVGYRLHILGNLNLGLKDSSGNQCLKDIILSLKWMQQNIQVFGGDPENITLLGSSSGSAIVHFLMLSPLAKGLYHKVILMGMYVFNPTLVFRKEHMLLAYENARERGYEGKPDDGRKLLKFYKQLDIHPFLLSKIHKTFDETSLEVFPTSPYIPLSDPNENSPLPLPLRELIPSTNQIPTMIGFCQREGAMGVAILKKMKRQLSKWFRNSINQNSWGWGANLNDNELKQIQKEVEKFYLEDNESMDTASLSTKCDILTDVALSDIYDTLVNVVSSNPASPVYVYNFVYDGNLSTMKDQLHSTLQEPLDGAFHAADYAYWCCTTNRTNVTASQVKPKDRQMIDTFTNLLTTFAKTGNPNYENFEVDWKPSTSENPCYLNINEVLEMKDQLLNGKRMEFWHKLKKQFNPDCN